MNNEIDSAIDDLDFNLTGEEAVKLIDPNSLKARLARKKVRYWLYCLRSQAEKGKKLPEDLPLEEIKEKFEKQLGFDGWKNFATTWDISLSDIDVVISRMFSEEEEWNRVVLAKFPQIQQDGSIKYPDMRVKKAIEEEIKLQENLTETIDAINIEAKSETNFKKESHKQKKKR